MRKFIVEFGFVRAPIGVDQEIIFDRREVDAESKIEAEIAVLTTACARPHLTSLRAFPAKQDEKGAWVEDEQTCGNCGWLHPETTQYAMGGPYDRNEPWCWATPNHCHRRADLPACASWKTKEG